MGITFQNKQNKDNACDHVGEPNGGNIFRWRLGFPLVLMMIANHFRPPVTVFQTAHLADIPLILTRQLYRASWEAAEERVLTGSNKNRNTGSMKFVCLG